MEPIATTISPLFIIGTLSGAFLLLTGLIVGIWLSRRPHLPAVSRPVVIHPDAIGDSGKPDIPPPAVASLVSKIAEANEHVQNRLEKAEAVLQQQAAEIATYVSEARTDSLTGLPNRRAFDDELTRRLAEWRWQHRPVSLLMLDIDHFKRFNDRHGHLAGDAVLVACAETLRQSVHDSDLVARLGGEEFAVVLPACELEGAALAGERVRQAVEDTEVKYEGQTLYVTISCGVAQALEDESATSLIKRADEALYASKAAGRNCVHLHNGQSCDRQEPRTPVRRTPRTTPLAEQREFQEVCSELRSRLATLLAQE